MNVLALMHFLLIWSPLCTFGTYNDELTHPLADPDLVQISKRKTEWPLHFPDHHQQLVSNPIPNQSKLYEELIRRVIQDIREQVIDLFLFLLYFSFVLGGEAQYGYSTCELPRNGNMF